MLYRPWSEVWSFKSLTSGRRRLIQRMEASSECSGNSEASIWIYFNAKTTKDALPSRRTYAAKNRRAQTRSCIYRKFAARQEYDFTSLGAVLHLEGPSEDPYSPQIHTSIPSLLSPDPDRWRHRRTHGDARSSGLPHGPRRPARHPDQLRRGLNH